MSLMSPVARSRSEVTLETEQRTAVRLTGSSEVSRNANVLDDLR